MADPEDASATRNAPVAAIARPPPSPIEASPTRNPIATVISVRSPQRRRHLGRARRPNPSAEHPATTASGFRHPQCPHRHGDQRPSVSSAIGGIRGTARPPEVASGRTPGPKPARRGQHDPLSGDASATAKSTYRAIGPHTLPPIPSRKYLTPVDRCPAIFQHQEGDHGRSGTHSRARPALACSLPKYSAGVWGCKTPISTDDAKAFGPSILRP